MRFFRKARESLVEFCERRGSVCDASSRREALLAQAREKALVSSDRFA